jgi:hypothetical protein
LCRFLYGNVRKCMEKVFTVIVCTRVMRLTSLTIVEEDCKLVEVGLNALLNETASKSIGSENSIVL